MSSRLYVVVRHDLAPGAQAAQAAHALAALALKHPIEFRRWNNQTIVLLETTSKRSLRKIVAQAEDGNFVHATFTEPDYLIQYYARGTYSGQSELMTAVAFAPNWLVQSVLLADLPLAVRENKKWKWFN